jgi:hypothetical protein
MRGINSMSTMESGHLKGGLIQIKGKMKTKFIIIASPSRMT